MTIREDADRHRAQRAFRCVLEAFAHPGTVHRLAPAPENPASPVALDASLELVVRLFVDQAVTFCVADSESDAVAAYLTSETHARRVSLRDADFVVVPARADAQTASEAVAEACRGTLVSPEKGATLLMGCARLADVPESGEVTEPAVHVVALQGPGVEHENRFAVDRVDWLRARDARGDEFPCGIEIVLVDPEGRIAAVPRSSSARRLADPASDLARDAATNPAPGLDPSTDPASMFHVKQSTQCSATKEQMFHVKHSEPVPAMPGASGASPRAEISVGAGCCPPAGARQGSPAKPPDTAAPGASQTPATLPRVLDYLRAQGLLAYVEADDAPPVDATMAPLSFPAPRSVRLQTLARGMTQAVEALGYAAIRGFGPAHPTVGELRSGRVAVAVDHPLEAGDEQDAYYLGSVPVTEVESVFESEGESDAGDGAATATRSDGGGLSLAIGYGLVFGRAETKAIAMSVLDHCLEHGDKRFPTEDEEFVLYHVDGVEATGFISHLKLPHYVTFQSKLSSVRGTRDDRGEHDRHGTRVAHDPQRTRDPHDQPAESKEARDAAAL